jgi:ribosomal protein L30/L7E
MLDKIEKKYGKNVNMIMGDWSPDKQMKHFAPTPNIGIKRKLRERFMIYNIDEYNTSKLHHSTEQVGKKNKFPDKPNSKWCPIEKKQIRISDKNPILREKHSVLIFQLKRQRWGCINRDNNACLNMIKLVKHYLETGRWLEKYIRPVNKEGDQIFSVQNGKTKPTTTTTTASTTTPAVSPLKIVSTETGPVSAKCTSPSLNAVKDPVVPRGRITVHDSCSIKII